jgi:hypothetical protein
MVTDYRLVVLEEYLLSRGWRRQLLDHTEAALFSRGEQG